MKKPSRQSTICPAPEAQQTTACSALSCAGRMNHLHSCTVSSTATLAVVQLPTVEDSGDYECYCDIVAAAPPATPSLNGADPPQFAIVVTMPQPFMKKGGKLRIPIPPHVAV